MDSCCGSNESWPLMAQGKRSRFGSATSCSARTLKSPSSSICRPGCCAGEMGERRRSSRSSTRRWSLRWAAGSSRRRSRWRRPGTAPSVWWSLWRRAPGAFTVPASSSSRSIRVPNPWIDRKETAVRTHVGQYRIDGVIGRGGMGVVYRGLHESLGREVAIKALAPELTQQPEFRERFFAEAKTQARIQHPNIVGVYDLLEDAGEYFIVMELAIGEGLDDRMRAASTAGLMDLDEALRIFGQMLSALDYAHSEGVIHRDVKPSNVILAAGGRVKLTDFGI